MNAFGRIGSRQHHWFGIFVLGLVLAAGWVKAGSVPLFLDAENPHYLFFRGKPVVLVGSSEHYGSVLNLGFNYQRYLDTLAADHLNCARLFTGTYHELPGDFGIVESPLAPKPGDFICPWEQVAADASGKRKFDLNRYSDAYFARFHDFLTQASKRGIVVEVNLFSPNYFDNQWAANPMNAQNNINGVGAFPRAELYTLNHPDLLKIQDAMVRRVVAACRDFDNVYFEVCNEPYEQNVPLDWQNHMVDVIRDAEKGMTSPHLISMNVAKGSKKIDDPNPGVSIFNFHYCSPPDAVAENANLNRVIGFNETGFKGKGDEAYRAEGWEFLLAGGGLFIHLDYSFTAETPDGTSTTYEAPGGGSPALRRQLGILKTFMADLDFVHMSSANAILPSPLPNGTEAWALAKPGKEYAIYLHGGPQSNLKLALPAGNYTVRWLNPVSGKHTDGPTVKSDGQPQTIPVPAYERDIVLTLKSGS